MNSNVISRRIESIQAKGAMRSADVAHVLDVRPETVSRWNNGKAFPHASKERQLLEFEFIVGKLADIHEPRDTRLWLLSRQRMLEDRRPVDLIRQGRIDEVLAAVNRLLADVTA